MKGLFLAAFVFLSLSISAQDTSDDQAFALLYTAGNQGILVIRGDRSLQHADESMPTVVIPGDQITTDGSTTAEIVTYPSRSRVVVGENSSILIDQLDGALTELTIQYGRLRGELSESVATRLQVHGITTTAVSEAGSFGVDQLVDAASGDIVARAYALEGTLSVYTERSGGDELSGDATVELAPGQVVTRRGADAIAQPGGLPTGISTYWSSRPPVAPVLDPDELLASYGPLEPEIESALGAIPSYLVPPEPEPVVEAEPDPIPEPELETAAEEPQLQQPVPVGEVTSPDEDLLRSRRSSILRTTGAIVAATGVLADISAIALNRYGADVVNNWEQLEKQTLETLSYTGGGLIAGGLLFLTLSVIIGN